MILYIVIQYHQCALKSCKCGQLKTDLAGFLSVCVCNHYN